MKPLRWDLTGVISGRINANAAKPVAFEIGSIDQVQAGIVSEYWRTGACTDDTQTVDYD